MRVFFRATLSERYPVKGAMSIVSIAFMERIIEVRNWIFDRGMCRRSSRTSGIMGTMKPNKKLSAYDHYQNQASWGVSEDSRVAYR
jgi:hypothetical protein